MLELRNVNTFYGNIQALRDVNIRINEGEIVTLIGANGADREEHTSELQSQMYISYAVFCLKKKK